MDYTHEFNTPLTPEEEARYRRELGDKANDTYDYDMRGFWKSQGQLDPRGHAGDQFKKPNHPTFSDQSQYSNFAVPGGHWSEPRIPEKVHFTPSHVNIENMGEQGLQAYFEEVEPENILDKPPKGAE